MIEVVAVSDLVVADFGDYIGIWDISVVCSCRVGFGSIGGVDSATLAAVLPLFWLLQWWIVWYLINGIDSWQRAVSDTV